ncbi:right-handed parallel beta-helix repeat-containing protein [Paenibacillus sp. NPDC056579]|uniref:right-handed parallel beta-helix repeat-containing protein n=1 Tax=Paenibacillus sp. NPDC056579 TaxID=3345871 RepID=UPI003694C481
MTIQDNKETESGKPMTRRQLIASVGAAGALLAMGAGLPKQAEAAKTTIPVTDNKPWFNVKDFGATGTGSNDDDSPYIQAAIDAAGDKGGTVFLPAGRYKIDRWLNLRSKVSILGAGAGVTVLRAGEPNLLMIYGGAGAGSFSIENLSFEGYGPSGAAGEVAERGIHIVEATHVTIRGCRFHDITNGVRLVRSRHVSLLDCTFTQLLGSETPSEGYGIVVEGGSNHTIQGNHFKTIPKSCIHLTAGATYCTVSGNIMEQCLDAAILLSSNLNSCSYHLIEGNMVTANGLLDQQSSCTIGIRLKDSCSYNTIVNNVINRPSSAGIQLEAGDNAGDDRPYGNTMTGNTVVSSPSGITVINGDANSVKSNEVRRAQTGVLLNTVGEGATKRNAVTNNSLYQCTGAAINIGSARCESNSVFGNTGFDNAENVKDSGTGTITNGF